MTEFTNAERGDSIRAKINAVLAKAALLAIENGKLKALGDVVFGGAIVERNYTIPAPAVGTTTPVVLDPANGTHQKITLARNTTFTSNIADGENVTLILVSGDTHVVTWFPVTWVTDLGGEPQLETNDAITFWRFGTVTYAAHIGGWN